MGEVGGWVRWVRWVLGVIWAGARGCDCGLSGMTMAMAMGVLAQGG